MKLDSYHYEKQVAKLQDEVKQLKEELRKYQVLQYTPNELEIELNKAIIARLKLEEIEALIEIESDLDLHPEAEELKTSLEIKRILDKLKAILKEDK